MSDIGCDHGSGKPCPVYFCAWCHMGKPWCDGCADELFDMCDDCADIFLPLYDDPGTTTETPRGTR